MTCRFVRPGIVHVKLSDTNESCGVCYAKLEVCDSTLLIAFAQDQQWAHPCVLRLIQDSPIATQWESHNAALQAAQSSFLSLRV